MDLAISTKTFDCTIDDGLAHIVLNQPDRGNPIDGEFCREFSLCIAEFSERADAEEAIRRLNNQAFKGRLLAVNEARAREDRTTTGPPRIATPRAPTSTDTRDGDDRSFAPDAAPRRRRTPAKGAAKSERGPKRPMYKRATGPVRFSAEDDDGDEEEVHGAHGARRRADAGEHDTA